MLPPRQPGRGPRGLGGPIGATGAVGPAGPAGPPGASAIRTFGALAANVFTDQTTPQILFSLPFVKAAAGSDLYVRSTATALYLNGAPLTFENALRMSLQVEGVDYGGNAFLVPAADSELLAWGNSNIAAGADTRFLDCWYNQATAPTTATTSIVAPQSGSLSNLTVRHNVAAGNGASVVYEVLVNGVASGITVTLATGAAGQASDFVNSASVAQGDRITLRAVKAASIGSGAQEATVTLELHAFDSGPAYMFAAIIKATGIPAGARTARLMWYLALAPPAGDVIGCLGTVPATQIASIEVVEV